MLDQYTPPTETPRHILRVNPEGFDLAHAEGTVYSHPINCLAVGEAANAFFGDNPTALSDVPTGSFWVSVGEDGNLEVGSRVNA